MPRPELLYAQVIKTMRRRRLVRVTHRVVFGTREAVEQVLDACGWQLQTACVERLNLTIRQHVAAIGQRVNTGCTGEDGLRQQVVLFQTYYHFVLPHASLRQARLQPVRTNGNSSATLRRPCTPAMAAGVTDRVWSLREVLLFRVRRGRNHKVRPLRSQGMIVELSGSGASTIGSRGLHEVLKTHCES